MRLLGKTLGFGILLVTAGMPGRAVPNPPAAAFSSSPATADRHLVLDRRQRRLTVIELAVDPTWEHPATGRRIPPGPANPLGSRWIGFHRNCNGLIGFNGTEHLVVKGCVRLLDEHVRELFELVQLGTPVTVLPLRRP